MPSYMHFDGVLQLALIAKVIVYIIKDDSEHVVTANAASRRYTEKK